MHRLRIHHALALVATVGCTPGDDPRFRGEPELRPYDDVSLAWELEVRLDRPAELTVRLDDARGARTLVFPTADHHRVPILGLLPHDEVRLELTAADGRGEGHTGPIRFTTDGLPRRFPVVEVLALDEARVEPGYWMLPVELVEVADGPSVPYLVALDEHLRVVWAWRTTTEFGAVAPEPDGTWLALAGGSAYRLDLTGEALVQWGRDREEPRGDRFVDLDLRALNHEVVPRAGGGFWSLSSRTVEVADFPCDYAEPEVGCGPADLDDPHVVAVTEAGRVVSDWSMVARLDPTRIGYDALAPSGRAYDWGHANAVVPLPDGGVLVSLRHQDALAALDANGALRWILGHHGGWSPKLVPFLLEPVGDGFAWPWHAHGPAVDADGTIWLFDNGNWQSSPYDEPTGAPWRSRVVGYRVDEAARTVEQVAARDQTTTGPLFSRALGNAAALPLTGNVAGLYGMTTDQGGASHEALGWGSRVVRLVQWSPEGEVVADLRLRSDLADERNGWRSYRAVHTPSLYAEGVETWEEAR